ncbi:MAG: hypothetical protein C0501_24880 [Isosphaera sp.]|nr:hypothetical protein [Isosphaera sp.]
MACPPAGVRSLPDGTSQANVTTPPCDHATTRSGPVNCSPRGGELIGTGGSVVPSRLPSGTDHRWTDPSSPPAASVFPSGPKTSFRPCRDRPSNCPLTAPPAGSTRSTTPSPPDTAATAPSGERATADGVYPVVSRTWPVSFPVAASQNCTSRAGSSSGFNSFPARSRWYPQVATRRPSADRATNAASFWAWATAASSLFASTSHTAARSGLSLSLSSKLRVAPTASRFPSADRASAFSPPGRGRGTTASALPVPVSQTAAAR